MLQGFQTASLPAKELKVSLEPDGYTGKINLSTHQQSLKPSSGMLARECRGRAAICAGAVVKQGAGTRIQASLRNAAQLIWAGGT